MVHYKNRLARSTCDGLRLLVGGNYQSQTLKDARKMAIRTGLSKSVAGHLIELDRDTESKVATVTVRPDPKMRYSDPTEIEIAAIKVAADLLAQQAKRFLGLEWTVVQWQRQ